MRTTFEFDVTHFPMVVSVVPSVVHVTELARDLERYQDFVLAWASPLPSTWTSVPTREAAFAWGHAQLDGRRHEVRWF